MRENVHSGTAQRANAERSLTHLLDCTERRAIMDATKHCPRCERTLPLDAYYPSQRNKNSSYCKRCSVAWQKERYRAIRGIAQDLPDLRLKRGPEHHFWKGEAAAYETVHERLRVQRGPASGYPCQHCDRDARDWAYDNTDPYERYDDRGCAYSLDLEHYVPLCKSCHKLFDLARRKEVMTSGRSE